MLLDLKNIDYYYLTHNNNNRKCHMKNEFIKYNLFEINPNPLFNGNRCKSASSGFLKILEIASNTNKTNFKPFVMLEDDVKKKDNYPDNIEIPDDCDLFYLCHSLYGINNNTLIKPIFITVNDDIVKLINILTNTAIAICSIKGLLHMQKCMMTVFYENKPWDIPLANSIYKLNVYSTTEELIYQYAPVAGPNAEKNTYNLPYLKKDSITDIPEFVFVNAKNLPLLVSNNLIKIKIFAAWTDSNTIYNKVIDEYDWKDDSKYGVEYIFTKQNDFTHAIIMNLATPKLMISKKNVLGLAQEPAISFHFEERNNDNNFICYCRENVNKYLVGSIKHINQSNSVLFVEKMSYQLPHISYKIVNNYIQNYPKKDKLINFVYSKKNPGYLTHLYHYRHELGNTVLENNIPVDIYGSSTDNLKNKFPNKENIKYGFDWKDVNKVYENYKFSIVIENTREPEYFSEKIFIPLLCGCIPIYLGSTNIDKYFKDYVIHLSGNVKDDLNLINSIINDPDKYYKKINIEDVKEKIHLKNIIHQEFL
tara:strand:- start:659 stop:2263 length:1605 start_codon:yes stop_codon:yes gene_type:complete